MSRRSLLLASLCALALAGATIAASLAAASAPTLMRVGFRPAAPAGASVVGALSSATRMHITVALRPRDPAALAAYAGAVSTPGSSSYRQYLTPGQFAARFGPTTAQVDAVEASLRAHGLTPGPVAANHLAIPVSATAGRIAHAFSLSFQRLELPSGLNAVINTISPALDGAVAGTVQQVIGLSSVYSPRPLAVRPAAVARARADAIGHIATGGPQPCASASQAAPGQGAYTTDEVASAYGFSGLYGAGDLGQGETIALYELEPNDPADVAQFQACYGTHAPVSYIPVDGGAGSGAGSGEAALDIEAAIGLAPRATFLVYQAPNANVSTPGSGPFDAFEQIITDDRARVVSASWGQCEPVEGASDAVAESNLFQEAAVQGQTIVSAAGDQGSEDCNGNPNPDLNLNVDDPASQPFVTGVGGTTLSSLGPRPAESVWNSGGNPLGNLLGLGPGAGGGGVSQLWRMPAYQSTAVSALHVVNGRSASGCGTSTGFCREVPDVSLDADPNTGFLIYYNGSGTASGSPSGWQGIGGTSVGAPAWAALIALADASRACHGSQIGFANPALYRAAGAAYPTDFNDVTTGNNDYTGTNGGRFPATAGYDMATGLGTPNAAALATSICADGLALTNPGPQSSATHAKVRLQLHATDVPGQTVSFIAAGLPAGLKLDRATGLISGTPTKPGTSLVKIAASDPGGGLGAAAFSWTVGGAPHASHASLSGVGSGRPRLSFTVTAGGHAPALQSFRVTLPGGLRFPGSTRRVNVTGAHGGHLGFAATVSHGALTIRLGIAATQVHVTISYATLTADSSLASAARSRRPGRLAIGVRSTDAVGHGTQLTLKLSPNG